MSAEPMAWARNYDPRGALRKAQTHPPHLFAEAGNAERAIGKMTHDQADGLADFTAPDAQGRRRPGPQFWHDFRRALIAVEDSNNATIDGQAHNDPAWAELIATPARGPRRHRKLLRLGRRLREAHGPETALALMQTLNMASCCPPLQPHEVEPLWRWVCSRHEERQP